MLPTFLYAMPFSPTRVFLEETSLVARPAVGFPELRARLRARLAHMGVFVTAIEEEEYCLIPMGGVLPRLPQRVLGIGGTAGMVHPSTGAFQPLRLNPHPMGCVLPRLPQRVLGIGGTAGMVHPSTCAPLPTLYCARQQWLGHERHGAVCV